MKSYKTTISFHRNKEDNWDLYDKIINQDIEIDRNDVLYLGYEVLMEIEIFEDGTHKVLKIDGKDVSELDMKI